LGWRRYPQSWRDEAIDHTLYPSGSWIDKWLLGEDEYGDLLCPSRTKTDWWDRRLNLKNPTHWPYWLVSRVTKKVVMIERP